MLSEMSERSEEKEGTPGPKFLLRSEAGALILLTRSWIDNNFLEKRTAFVSACEGHSALVYEYHRLLAYTESDRFPRDIVKKTSEIFQQEHPALSIRHAVAELERRVSLLEKKILRSEQKHEIGAFTTPELMCLSWMNNFYSPNFQRWNDIQSVRVSFRKENREFLESCCIDGATSFRDEVYFPEIEKMMNKAQKEMLCTKKALEREPTPFLKARKMAFDETVELPIAGTLGKRRDEKRGQLSRVELKANSKSKSCCIC